MVLHWPLSRRSGWTVPRVGVPLILLELGLGSYMNALVSSSLVTKWSRRPKMNLIEIMFMLSEEGSRENGFVQG